ncbi:MAG: CopG family transcriptional regulator [Acidobacteria bacterium]|nr:CopG family transcriptional regulator [Acidobacteriota bacterium]
MLKNVTITLSEEAAHWARKKAADENTSVSRLVGRMIEDQMRLGDAYWQAYERWKKLPASGEKSAKNRLSRSESHERR